MGIARDADPSTMFAGFDQLNLSPSVVGLAGFLSPFRQ